MRLRLALFAGILLSAVPVSLILCQNSYERDTTTLSISPVHPALGDTITITYNTHNASPRFKEPKNLSCAALLMRPGDLPLLVETSLHPAGEHWIGTMVLDDSAARFAIFSALTDEDMDDNGGQPCDALVYDNAGKPLPGAHEARGSFYMNERYTNLSTAKQEFLKEQELYPESWKVVADLWELSLKENDNAETRSGIRRNLDVFYGAQKNNDDALSTIVQWYENLGDSLKAKTIRQEYTAKNPHGRLARSVRAGAITNEKNPSQKVQLIESYLSDFPSLEKRKRTRSLEELTNNHLLLGNMEGAVNALERIPHPAGSLYTRVARYFIDKDQNLEGCLTVAEKGIQLCENPHPDTRPPYIRPKVWEENNKYYLGKAIEAYADDLVKLGRSGDAEGHYRRANQLLKINSSNVLEHYVRCLNVNQKYDSAMSIGISGIRQGGESPELIGHLRDAFAKKISKKGESIVLTSTEQKTFDGILTDAREVMMEGIRVKALQGRIGGLAPDFTLMDLTGAPVTLSAYRGKVVVLSFWASWCGDCKESMKAVEQLRTKFQSNERVAILSINTWERQRDHAATATNAKNYLAQNGLTLPILIDRVDGRKVADEFGVNVIPTKLVLDGRGNIAFKCNYTGGQELQVELGEQINFLLSELFGSNR